jgi:hypothetical protein
LAINDYLPPLPHKDQQQSIYWVAVADDTVEDGVKSDGEQSDKQN